MPGAGNEFYVQRSKFAAYIMGIATTADIGEEMQNVQFIWEKRKTKVGTEARLLQESLQAALAFETL